MSLTCCPQEELGGLLGGAGREQPHLLQGVQGAGTHCLGEWGARGVGWESGGMPERGEVWGGTVGTAGREGYGGKWGAVETQGGQDTCDAWCPPSALPAAAPRAAWTCGGLPWIGPVTSPARRMSSM